MNKKYLKALNFWAETSVDERAELLDKAEELLNRFSQSDAVWIGGSG